MLTGLQLDVQHATTACPERFGVLLQHLLVPRLVEGPHKGEDQPWQGTGRDLFDEAPAEFLDQPAERWAAELEERQHQVDGLMIMEDRRPVLAAISWPTVILPTAGGPTTYNNVGGAISSAMSKP